MLSLPQIYIISAELSHLDKNENMARSLDLESTLVSHGIPYKTLYGSYKGVTERSFLVTSVDKAFVLGLARKFNQESILESNSQRETALVFTDGTSKYIGKLHPVSKEAAKAKENYSYCEALNQHYIVE